MPVLTCYTCLLSRAFVRVPVYFYLNSLDNTQRLVTEETEMLQRCFVFNAKQNRTFCYYSSSSSFQSSCRLLLLNSGENTVSVSLECFARVKERLDRCGNHTLPSVIVTTEPIKNAYKELLRRGIKTRFITEITEKNIEYCKLINYLH